MDTERKVFLLQHVHEFEDGHEDVKLIGVFSTEQTAREAQQQVADQPGFRDCPEGFSIDAYRLDEIWWSEGYGDGNGESTTGGTSAIQSGV